jgi:hypothetical protein
MAATMPQPLAAGLLGVFRICGLLCSFRAGGRDRQSSEFVTSLTSPAPHEIMINDEY